MKDFDLVNVPLTFESLFEQLSPKQNLWADSCQMPQECHEKEIPVKTEKIVYEDDTHHKYFPAVNLFVPRESYVQAELATFLAPIEQKKNIKVRGYQGCANGQLPLAEKYRHEEYLRVRKLTLFSTCLFYDMKKGHQSFWLKKRIERCLTLSYGDVGIIGAIHFEISFISSHNQCFIRKLEIDSRYHNKGFGSVLLQAALLVALLYDCNEVDLIPSKNAKTFYKNHGFSNDSLVGLGLNFKNRTACSLLVSKVAKTAPHYHFEERIKQLPQEHPWRVGLNC